MGVDEKQVAATVALLNENATIPFIARYRKEKTGSLDEVQIATIADEYHRYLEIEDRKATILKTIDEQGKLTDELKARIEKSWDLTELEDIYLPYKPHRKTRADVAREQGYEPLAEAIFAQKREGDEAMRQIGERLKARGEEAKKAEEALQGARDIIAEWISQDEQARNGVRREFTYSAILTTKVIKGKESEEDAQKYRDYFAVKEPTIGYSPRRSRRIYPRGYIAR